MKKKFKIWTEQDKQTPSDEYCYLRLDEGRTEVGPEGAVAVVACDANGEQLDHGAILVLDSRLGVIINVAAISDDIPLKTDITNTALIYDDREAEEALRPQLRMTPITMADIAAKMAEGCEMYQAKEPTIN